MNWEKVFSLLLMRAFWTHDVEPSFVNCLYRTENKFQSCLCFWNRIHFLLENSMVKFFNWLFRWSYHTSNNNVSRVMCADCCLVCIVYLVNMFHRRLTFLTIRLITSLLLLCCLSHYIYFLSPFFFLLLNFNNTSILIYMIIFYYSLMNYSYNQSTISTTIMMAIATTSKD